MRKKIGKVANYLSEATDKAFIATLKAIIGFEKNVIKRYFNIELPLYKMWWEAHSEIMQRRMKNNMRRYTSINN